MTTPLILIAGILLLGAVYVLPPVVLEAWTRYRGRKQVRCPGNGRMATVELDARHAALTAIVGQPRLRLSSCSRWPEQHDCDRGCLKEL